MRLKYFLLLTILWMPFPYSSNYEVCNYGLVRNAKTGQILTAHENHVGYLRVKFRDTNKNFRVHRLVAVTFFGDEGEMMHVNHKDFNKRNNAIYNLEWMTPKGNVKHNFAHGRNPSKLKYEDVKMVKDMIRNEVPVEDISLILDIPVINVRNIRDGKTWKEVA